MFSARNQRRVHIRSDLWHHWATCLTKQNQMQHRTDRKPTRALLAHWHHLSFSLSPVFMLRETMPKENKRIPFRCPMKPERKPQGRGRNKKERKKMIPRGIGPISVLPPICLLMWTRKQLRHKQLTWEHIARYNASNTRFDKTTRRLPSVGWFRGSPAGLSNIFANK